MAFNKSLKTNLVVQSYDTTGKHSSDLNPFEFAILDADTYTSLSALQVQGKDVLFSVGSPNQGQTKSNLKIDRLRDELNSQLSFKSQPMNVGAIKTQKFTEDTRTNVYYFGYNGLDDCKTLEFECGKTYEFDVYVKGRAVRNIFGREMREIIPVTAPCCSPCTDGDCSDTIECAVVIDELVKNFNDPNRWISRFYTAEKVVSCSHTGDQYDTLSLYTFCLTVCDAGTEQDLARVQESVSSNYGLVTVKSREGAYTTYQVQGKVGDSNTPPANFTIDGVVLKDCDECPSGFTLAAGGFAYLIEVDQASSAESSLATLQALNGFSTLTSRTQVYWDKGTSGYYVTSSALLTTTTADAKIVKYLGEIEQTCTQDTPLTYSWAGCGECLIAQRYMAVTIGLDDCDPSGDFLSAWDAFLDAHPELEEEAELALSVDGCTMRGVVVQFSNCVEEGCDTDNVYTFPIMPTLFGQTWIETDSSGDPCTEADLPTGCKCGIKFTGRSFNDLNTLLDLPVYDLLEYVEKDPIELTVSLLEPDGQTQVCEDKQPSWWWAQKANFRTLHGRDVMKEILTERLYRAEPYWNLTDKESLLLQKREGLKYGVDVNAYYNAITISGNVARDLNWTSHEHRVREDVVLFIHQDDIALFNELRGFLNGAFPNAKFTEIE